MAGIADLILKVSEVYYSIQGESTYAGAPCAFIRMADCNLRCTYCDARYTFEEPGEEHSLADLVRFTDNTPTSIVEITGGEPLLQDNIYPLMKVLVNRNRTVLLETNGSISLAKVPKEVIKVMDIKCPGSKMHDKMDLENLKLLTPQDNIKFVLTSKADFQWAVELLHNYYPKIDKSDGRDMPTILFSPVLEQLHPAPLTRLILETGIPGRLQLQLHKILWPNQKRGI